MISFDTIGMLFQFEAVNEEHHFTKLQSQELFEIGVKMSELKSGIKHLNSGIFKYKKLEKEYIEKFIEYGGNKDILNTKLREFEKNSLPLINEFSKKIKQLKESMKVK